jgi:hypothetical protein
MTTELVSNDEIKKKRYTTSRKKYTEEQLLEYLRVSYREIGRIHENNDFTNNDKYPCYSIYRRYFGSWNRSIELRGLKREPNYEYTNDQLLEYLRKFYRETGTTPEARNFNNNPKYPGYSVYQKRFGSWNNAIILAGLQTNCFTKTKDSELLRLLKQFHNENGRPPVQSDFVSNQKYPSFVTYQNRFGSWQKALKLVELDVNSIVRKGILETTQQKGRLSELYVLEHFTGQPIDLSGENCKTPIDGICPKGQNYDVNSASLINKSYTFTIHNMHKYEIEWFYLVTFDKGFKKLMYVWRIPGDFIDTNSITIDIDNGYTYNIENMKEFEITDKFKDSK